MATEAPVIRREMDAWIRLGGGNSGIVGNAAHRYGFHRAANEVGAGDYSRSRDPAGPNAPANWSWACAGDFSHKNQEGLRARHREVLARLMRGDLPMICEFIGKPWADRPVYYWSRWSGKLIRYTGSGHDHWTHLAWYRSRADQQPSNLWGSGGVQPPPPPPSGGLVVDGQFGPATCRALQRALNARSGAGLVVDGEFGPATKKALQRYLKVTPDGDVGPQTIRALQRHVGAAVDGAWGPDTTRALQRALNAGTF